MDKRHTFHLASLIVLASLALAGCLGQSDEGAGAERALVGFFSHLSEGNYQAAAEIYGGSYEVLTAYNPDLDPANFPALWERACTRNGFQCLLVDKVLDLEETGEGVYHVAVQFQTAAGDTFELEACCGEDPGEAAPLTEFDFRVARDQDGRFRVLDLPVYLP